MAKWSSGERLPELTQDKNGIKMGWLSNYYTCQCLDALIVRELGDARASDLTRTMAWWISYELRNRRCEDLLFATRSVSKYMTVDF